MDIRIITKGIKYQFAGKEKLASILLMIVGAALLGVGVATNMDNPTRIWTAWLYNSTFFIALGFVALFFVTSQTLGYNGWFVMVRRIPEAMATYIKWGAILMLPILIFGMHDIYHWTHKELFDPSNHHYDALLAGKEPYLNLPFFYIRTALYLGLWVLFAWLIRRNSLTSDTNPSIGVYNRSKVYSAVFIVIFAVTSSTYTWDWLMSIQPHWYSTLFGWYCFISMFVTCMAFIILIGKMLKSYGLLPQLNEEHFHDLGKLMFAFSVAWAYLFFSQFMLIWYSNIPEETMYFKLRIEHYAPIMYAMVMLNFVAPFLLLITAGAKRKGQAIYLACGLIIFGHWLDYFQMTVPAAIAEAHLTDAAGYAIHSVGIGPVEIGFGCLYLGLFLFIVLRSLASAPLVPVNHPFVKESIVHHT